MENRRLEIINRLCKEVGIIRANPQSPYLSRRELLQLLGFIQGKKMGEN